ncbi:MAG TPA: polymer-forming cytoskeletal protein [Candidatus Tectomicrobia bacterium]|nr:polymer-forming cytoskeletal protein [Candidatus Tectomicrobia bacterium]
MNAVLRFFGLVDPGQDASRQSTPPDTTTIGPGVRLKGEIQGEGALLIHGHFEGDIVLNGIVEVGPNGRVDANVTAQAIVIGGAVRGNLSADTRVDILPTGSLTGSVRSGAFRAADGAVVKSELWVERSSPATGQPDEGAR